MREFKILVTYSDNTAFSFKASFEGEEWEYMALLNMVTRGTLMASSAVRATAYNEDGSYVVSYRK